MRTTGVRLGVFVLGLIAAGLGSARVGLAETKAASGWSAGAASTDITPAGPVWLAGYASRKSPSEGVTLPIHAKALALRDADGGAVVLVTADLVGFDRALMTTVTDQVK